MQYTRAFGNSNFPEEFGPYVKKDSADLFRHWLDTGKDFLKVVVKIRHVKTNSVEKQDGWGYVKLKTLKLSEENKQEGAAG